MIFYLLTQYVLMAISCTSTLVQHHERMYIGTHVYEASVLILVGTAYIIIGLFIHLLYVHATSGNGIRNPDLDEYNNIDLSDFESTTAQCDQCDSRSHVTHTSIQREHVTQETVESGSELQCIREDDIDELECDDIASTTRPKSVRSEIPPMLPMTESTANAEQTLIGINGGFYVNVYGLGIVMFVLVYVIDMTIIRTSLNFLVGLSFVGLRDVIKFLHINDTQSSEHAMFSRWLTVVSFMTNTIALTELFVAASASNAVYTTNESIHDKQDTLYWVLSTIIPYSVCVVLMIMQRPCSTSGRIKRAFPTTVLLALFTYVWYGSLLNAYTQIHNWERVWNTGLGQYLFTEYGYNNNTVYAADTELYRMFNEMNQYGGVMHNQEEYTSNMNAYTINWQPVKLLLEPLLRLMLTFSIISSVVHHKTNEVCTALTLITGVKELYLQPDDTNAYEHAVRSVVLSGCAVGFAFGRYLPCVHYCLRRLD